MLNFDRALNDDRLMKAITGLSASEFNKLVERFREEFQNEARVRYETGVEQGNRERKRLSDNSSCKHHQDELCL